MTDFVLGVDLDGVVADYETAMRQAMVDMTGKPAEAFGPLTAWNMAAVGWGFSDHDEFLVAHRRAVQELHLFETMPAIAGASETLWRLSDAGIWIRIITHRLVVNFAHAAAVADTVTWLDKERIPYRDICFIGDKPQVGADLYIDDAPHNIDALRDGGSQVLIFDQLYNRHLDGDRVADWAAVEEAVLAAADAKAGRMP